MVYTGVCSEQSFLKKYSMGQGNGNLVSLVPFFEHDEIITKFLQDKKII